MTSKINHSPDQQLLVARKLSNNDTLGRIAHQLRLPQHASARIDRKDRWAAEDWSREQLGSPPKLFADLFESYTGALFLRYGWHYTHSWLKKVYSPITAAADRDALLTTDVAPRKWSAPDTHPWSQKSQWAFEDFIEERGPDMKQAIKAALQALPRSEISPRREEVGMQLFKLWICELSFRLYPELHCARGRGAHFLSSITSGIMSEDTLGHVGLLMSLSSHLPPSDPDFLVVYPVPRNADKKDIMGNIDRARPKLASILKSVAGAFYLRHPTRARKWACRPIIGPSSKTVPKPSKPAPRKSDTAVDALLKTFENLNIDRNLKISQTVRSETSTPIKSKPKKYTIRINASWLITHGETDVENISGSYSDFELDLNPYKLLDEGGSFPLPESGKNGNECPKADKQKDLPRDGSESPSSNGLKSVDDKASQSSKVPLAPDSDGEQDMVFSSSESASDMEFSDSDEDFDSAEQVIEKLSERPARTEDDGLVDALERLDLAGTKNTTEDMNHTHPDEKMLRVQPCNTSSKALEPSQPCSKIEETDSAGPDTMDSAKGSFLGEDGEKDMEFSSDEESNNESGSNTRQTSPTIRTIENPSNSISDTKPKNKSRGP
ncbi:hypothetical protein H0H93_006088 [Arthromyces matolae]|nr:hypothetical protein H0H93_006088 [Arthromyces matolae]